MKKLTLYLAHPITGLSGADIFKYYDNIAAKAPNYYCLSPMVGKGYLRNIEAALPCGYKTAISNDHSIFQRDTWMVSQCDVVLCDFTNAEKTSIGCCMEIAIASWLNKHTVIVLQKNNIHNHAFILEAADIVYETLDDAIDYLNNLSEE